jgi:uncharacterized phage-associated protein
LFPPLFPFFYKTIDKVIHEAYNNSNSTRRASQRRLPRRVVSKKGAFCVAEREHDIVRDSYYLVSLFQKDGKDVTQLQLQKLMYFFEAYCMNRMDVTSLYDCQWNAWDYGPVAIPLRKAYADFGSASIDLPPEKTEQGERMEGGKKELMKKIYAVFGVLKASTLVGITHRADSPWDRRWKANGNKAAYGAQSYIDKSQMKEWFEKEFMA